jgi:NADH-quinone oxidoreductase subunit N
MKITIPEICISSIYPEIIITAFGIFVLLLHTFLKKEKRDLMGYSSLAGIILAALFLLNQKTGQNLLFNGLWVIDNYSRFFKLILLLATGLTLMISLKYVKDEEINHGEYFCLLMFATLGMMIIVSSADLITIFLGIELMSICLYALAGYTRNRLISNESSLKYFLLGSFATGFLLYGIALIYGATGTTALKDTLHIASKSGFNNHIIVIAMVFLFIGFGFKTASFPFHMWAPDVYEGAPSPITAFMSAGPKAAAFAGFVRVFFESFYSIHDSWVGLIWVIAVLTMFTGNIIALVQDNIKRMLAYSSIAHAGYILVAIVASNELGMAGILYYLLSYTLMNIGAFAIVIAVGGKGESFIKIDDYTGFGYKHPLAAAAMSLFLFSLAGIPPTAGFMGKFYIFSAAIKSGYIWLAILGVLNSVISVYYYLRVTVAMYMKESGDSQVISGGKIIFSPALIAALIISAFGVIKLGVVPSDYIAMAKQAALIFN